MKKSKSKKLIPDKVLKRVIPITLIVCGLLFASVGIFFGVTVFKEISTFDSEKLLNKESSIQISVLTGEEYSVLGTEGSRKTVKYEEIPQVMIDAIVAAEDSRYFVHNGFDLPRIVKALMGNIASGGITSGGSTITQQVIKNSYYTQALTGKESMLDKLQRKIGEVVLAIKLTRDTTKENVLELYLNKIYFGYGNKTVGIYNASRYYFDKAVSELTLPEAALLAGTLNSPNRYDPFKNLDLATKRRNTVLDLMEYHGYISETECEAAKSIPVENTLKSNPVNTGVNYQAYTDMVTREIQEKTGLDPYSTPMRIYTYMNPTLQKRLDEISKGIDFKFADQYIQAGACVQDNNGRIVGVLSARNYETLGSTNAYAKKGAKTGGYGQTHQPGSTLKPIISYASAFEFLDYSSAHYVSDIPIQYEDGMSPQNHNGQFHGSISIQNALSNSWNLAAIQTLKEVTSAVGSKKVVQYLEGFGFDMTGETLTLGHAIGGWDLGTTPKEVAGAYSAIANGGTYIEPHTVERIEVISTGEVIYLDEKLQEEKTTAISEESAFMIRDIMLSYANTGNYTVFNREHKIAGKTGTTNYASSHPNKALAGKSKDGWMSAFSPDYSWSVWVGYPDDVANEKNLWLKDKTDSREIAAEIAKILHKDGLQTDYPAQPQTLVKANIVSGIYPYVIPGDDVPANRIVSGYFKASNAPSRVVNAAKLNDLQSFNATIENGAIHVEFSEYDPVSMTEENPVPKKDYGGILLPYLGDENQIYGRVVYKVDVKDILGNILHTEVFNTNKGTLSFNLTPGMYYSVNGYYAFETGTGTSNTIEKSVIGAAVTPTIPTDDGATQNATDTQTQENTDLQTSENN